MNKEQKALCDDWEEEFDKALPDWTFPDEVLRNNVKIIITTILQKQRAEIIKELRDEVNNINGESEVKVIFNNKLKI